MTEAYGQKRGRTRNGMYLKCSLNSHFTRRANELRNMGKGRTNLTTPRAAIAQARGSDLLRKPNQCHENTANSL